MQQSQWKAFVWIRFRTQGVSFLIKGLWSVQSQVLEILTKENWYKYYAEHGTLTLSSSSRPLLPLRQIKLELTNIWRYPSQMAEWSPLFSLPRCQIMWAPRNLRLPAISWSAVSRLVELEICFYKCFPLVPVLPRAQTFWNDKTCYGYY